MKLFKKIQLKFNTLLKRIKKFFAPKFAVVNNKRKKFTARFFAFARRSPFITIFMLLAILLFLIVVSNIINKPKKEAGEVSLPVKIVSVYTIGESPKVTVQGVVEKSGVIKVVSLGGGVVQSLNAKVGDSVSQGSPLVSMSTNYRGGNVFTVQRELAQAQYQNILTTYSTQQNLINQQIELANKANDNTEELRKISSESVSSTQSLIDLNNSIINSLNQAISISSNSAEILQTKSLVAQITAGNNQLQQGLKLTQYNVNEDNPPSKMADISKNITLDQLFIQQKALALGKEVSRLSLMLAQITEATMFPSSPISGTVERVYVKEGQVVSPGTPLMQISGLSDSLIAVVPMSQDMAKGVSRTAVSTLMIGNRRYQAVPFYVSEDATDGSLFSAQYQIPQEFNSSITDRQYISIEVPISYPSTGGVVPFIPLDSVFQTQDRSFVFVVKDGVARSRGVVLGQVIGSFVEVKSGLSNSDQVILNRNVIDGDPVKVSN